MQKFGQVKLDSNSDIYIVCMVQVRNANIFKASSGSKADKKSFINSNKTSSYFIKKSISLLCFSTALGLGSTSTTNSRQKVWDRLSSLGPSQPSKDSRGRGGWMFGHQIVYCRWLLDVSDQFPRSRYFIQIF
jgi:hypothetical protein